MNLAVRQANKGDLMAINELTDLMHHYLASLYGLKMRQDEIDEERFDEEGLDNVYVAETADDGIIAYMSFSKESDEWTGPHYELEHIVVREDYRGRGVGRELFNALLERAKREEVNIKTGTLVRNRVALDFFGELGFKQLSVGLVLDLQNRILALK